MPIFELHNFTRYSTEDLYKLLDLVEKQVIKQHGEAKPAFFRTWSKENGVIPNVVTIKDFVPKIMYRRTSYYDSKTKKNVTVALRVYVKKSDTYRGSSDVRIVTPPLLWDTPIEALARCKDSSVIPDDATRAILERFWHLYYLPTNDEKDLENIHKLLSKTTKVRILDNLEAKVDKNEKLRAARERARKAFSDGGHAIGKVSDYATSLDECKTRGLNQLKRSKVPAGPDEETFAEAVRVLLEQVEVVKHAHAKVLAQEGE